MKHTCHVLPCSASTSSLHPGKTPVNHPFSSQFFSCCLVNVLGPSSMAPFEMISPISATKPAANLKRSRQSNVTPTAAPAHPRAKRRKPEGSAEPESNPGERDKSGRASNFGTGTGKGREDEFGDLGDVQTKVGRRRLSFGRLRRGCSRPSLFLGY